MKLIRDIRTSRNEMNVSQSKRTALYIKPLGANQSLIGKTAALIEKLAGGNKTEIVSAAPDGKNVVVVSEIAEVYIPLGELVDTEKELTRLNKELESVQFEIDRATGKLNNSGFVAKAPAALIDAERAKLAKYEEQKLTILNSIKNLG